jgi:hypothetical protein
MNFNIMFLLKIKNFIRKQFGIAQVIKNQERLLFMLENK